MTPPDQYRIHLDTVQYVRGLPTFMAFAATTPEAPPAPKLLPVMPPEEQVRVERCAKLDEMNAMLEAAFWEFVGRGEYPVRREGT